ncbi:hypothetical protein [Roseateles sp. BYS96W]|uniref:Uncharacterized protein n=1 Tax=Pelomonas nitida TaxID=3299027 RepID=A0ABW7GCZ9_9BURK
MTTSIPSGSKLVRLRRDAKNLARDQGIPLNDAQDRIAATLGYANWSLMAKASNSTANSSQERLATSAALDQRRKLVMALAQDVESQHSLHLLRQHTGVALGMVELYYQRQSKAEMAKAVGDARRRLAELQQN